MSWGSGIVSCNCTNQCPQCGVCCAVGCEHRGTGRVVVTDNTLPVQFGRIETGASEDRIREIVREELDLAAERLAGALIKGLKR